MTTFICVMQEARKINGFANVQLERAEYRAAQFLPVARNSCPALVLAPSFGRVSHRLLYGTIPAAPPSRVPL